MRWVDVPSLQPGSSPALAPQPPCTRDAAVMFALLRRGNPFCGRCSAPDRAHRPPTERSFTMLWTILIILAIVALVLFILGRVRGRRGV